MTANGPVPPDFVPSTVTGPLEPTPRPAFSPIVDPRELFPPVDLSPPAERVHPDLEAAIAAVEARVAAATARAELAESQLGVRQVVVDEYRAQHAKDLAAIAAKNETLARVLRTVGISDALKREAERSKAL